MKLNLLFVCFALLCGLIACQASPDLPELPPEVVVSQAAERLQSLPGFRFLVERQGDPAYIDPAQTIAFRRTEGYFVAPDKARAVVRVIAPGLVVDVSAIVIGSSHWETDFVTGRWQLLPPEWGFNPAVLFDSQTGLPAILASDLGNLIALPPEKLQDSAASWLYVVRGTVHGRHLHAMSHGLIADQEMEMTLWVDPDSFDLHQVALRLPNNPDNPDENATNWLVQLSQFGQTAAINPPQLD